MAQFDQSLGLLRTGDPARPLFVPWDDAVRSAREHIAKAPSSDRFAVLVARQAPLFVQEEFDGETPFRSYRILDGVVTEDSIGGWIAAEMASMAPADLSRLVLVGAMGIKPPQGDILDLAVLPGRLDEDLLLLARHHDAARRPDFD